jgi:two-component system sensor histidine kinase UhpB
MSSNPSLTEENVLGLISDNCPDLIALLDANGSFLYSNTAHLVRLGRSTESLIGTTVFELVHPEDADAFESTIASSAKRRSVFNVSARWQKENGKSARFESLGKWISADVGRSQYLLLCSREALRSEAVEKSAAASSELRADAAQLLACAEGERNQVARAIHDDLGQKLTSMSLELSLWKTELNGGHSKSVSAIREKISVLRDLVNSLIGCTRSISSTLRPRVLDEFGLIAALEWHLEKVQKLTGMACNFTSDGPKLDVDAFVAAQIFRIAEEVVKLRAQAGCKSLHVRLVTQDDAVALVFEDSGKERRLTPEVAARVRLLGGEMETNNEERSIMIALPTKVAGAALD